MCLIIFRVIDAFAAIPTQIVREPLRCITCHDVTSCVTSVIVTLLERRVVVLARWWRCLMPPPLAV